MGTSVLYFYLRNNRINLKAKAQRQSADLSAIFVEDYTDGLELKAESLSADYADYTD